MAAGRTTPMMTAWFLLSVSAKEKEEKIKEWLVQSMI